MIYKSIKKASLEEMIAFYPREYPISQLRFIVYTDPGKGVVKEAEVGEVFSGYEPRGERDRWLICTNDEDLLGEEWIEELEEKFKKKKEENLGLTSWIKLTNGEIRHIPMIDFQCPTDKEDKSKVLNFLSELDEKTGFLLESGQSYHYYGANLFTQAQWENFTERLKRSNLVGREWPGLQLRDGFSVLRLSTSAAKPALPRIIGIIGEGIGFDEEARGFLKIEKGSENIVWVVETLPKKEKKGYWVVKREKERPGFLYAKKVCNTRKEMSQAIKEFSEDKKAVRIEIYEVRIKKDRVVELKEGNKR